jgi:hypothetical protein
MVGIFFSFFVFVNENLLEQSGERWWFPSLIIARGGRGVGLPLEEGGSSPI